MSRETILAKVENLPSPPIAFQALWDAGDSFETWFVYMSAVLSDGNVLYLGGITYKEGQKVFGDRGPLWANAIIAQQLGNELAEQYGVEFYFPSPHHPKDECPDWNNRHNGYPCRCCGILLFQRPQCPWRGICYACHIDEERELREAQWTEEERAGPRCYICGNPAKDELNGHPICAQHFDAYENRTCEQCGSVKTTSKSTEQPWICHQCKIKNEVDALTPTQRDAIDIAMNEGRGFGFLKIREILECDINHTYSVIQWFIDQEPPE